MTSYERSTVTMSLSRTVSVTNGDFDRKVQNFPFPNVFNAPPRRGVTLKSCKGVWAKKNYQMMSKL